MYRSTAIFIKILQRRSQFRRVNIFCCYTFINSVGWLNPKYCARKRSVDRVCMGAQSSQTVSTILVFMAIMLTSQWLACFYTCCNTHLLWFWTRMRSNEVSTRKEKKPFNNLNSFVFFAFNVFSHLLFIYVCVLCVYGFFGAFVFLFSNPNTAGSGYTFSSLSIFIKSPELYTLFLTFVHISLQKAFFPFS